HQKRLQSGFRVDRKTRLLQSQISDNFPAHQLQVVGEIAKRHQECHARNDVEGAIDHYLEEGIIEQNAVARKPAADNYVVAFGEAVEQISNFRKKMLEVAV